MWGFEVTQAGQVVASGSAPDEATARRECLHYAMMYGQDGPAQGRWFEESDEEGSARP